MIDLIVQFYEESCKMAPWLLFGFLVAALVTWAIPQNLIKRHLAGKRFSGVVKASLFGVPLPLCSCGIIPVAAALRANGADRGATGSFFISTPQTGFDNVILTGNRLNWPIAAIRVVIAFLSGVVGGLLINLFDKDDETPNATKKEAGTKGNCCCSGRVENDLKEKQSSCCSERKQPEPQQSTKSCCGGSAQIPKPSEGSCCGGGSKHEEVNTGERPKGLLNILRFIFMHSIKMMNEMSFTLFIGIGIATIIQAFIPNDITASLFGGSRILEFGAMLLFGIPLYVCSNASVPIAAGLIAKGISPGAALVFLITGPATNSAAVAALFNFLGARATIIYLAVVCTGAVLGGILLNSGLVPISATIMPMHAEAFSWIDHACGITLISFMLFGLFQYINRRWVKKSLM